MSVLVLEPQEKSGLVVRWFFSNHKMTVQELKHGDDLVVALAKEVEPKKLEKIVVRIGVGSFSAGRAAVVVANCLGWWRAVPIYFVNRSIVSERDLAAALRYTKKRFSYAAPAHITKPKS